MQIPAGQIRSRRRIGSVGSRPLFEIGCIGGLFVVVAPKSGGGTEVLGCGSHAAIARHMAKRNPDVILDILEKAEQPALEDFADLLPRYDALLRDLQSWSR